MTGLEKFEGKTVEENLNDIASRNVCDEADEKFVWYVLNHVYKVKATVTCGMVYAEGTTKAEDIHTTAKTMLAVARAEGAI